MPIGLGIGLSISARGGKMGGFSLTAPVLTLLSAASDNTPLWGFELVSPLEGDVIRIEWDDAIPYAAQVSFSDYTLTAGDLSGDFEFDFGLSAFADGPWSWRAYHIRGATSSPVSNTVTQTIATATQILDLYPSASFGISTARKLRTAYAGNCMQVRETGGATDANIGFTANALNEAALTTHTGANNGLLTILYDQSGNSLNLLGDAVTDSNNFKPPIVTSGTIEKVNSIPSAFFDVAGFSDSMYISSGVAADSSCTILAVIERDATASDRVFIGGTTGSIFLRFTSAHKLEIIREFEASIYTTTLTVPLGLNAIAIVIDDAGTSSVRVNGIAAETFTTNVAPSQPIRLIGGAQIQGNNLGAFFFGGHISEVIVWPTAFNDTDRDAVVADAMTFYGIT